MAQAAAAASLGRHDITGTHRPREIPRDYNFAADILESNLAAGRAGKPAFIDSHVVLTYEKLALEAASFGTLLRAKGIRREERILMCMLDDVLWPIVFLGALKAGVIAVPVNTLMTESDYAFMLSDSRARMLVVSEELYPKFRNLIGKLPDLEHVIVHGAETFGHECLVDALAETQPEDYTAPTTRDDIAFWLYTSGSTGKPKGAVHVHASLKLTNDLYAAPILDLREDDICYSVAKLFFAYGLGNALTFPMSAGATTVLMEERPTPDSVTGLLRKHRVTVFYGVPTFYAGYLASSSAISPALTSFRRCVSAGEALPADVGRRWSETYGCDILDGIGSTEMLHIFLSNAPGATKYGTTGKPVPGYMLKLIDEHGQPVKPGEMGELLINGPSSAIMYWNNRERSRHTFMGEWTRSGDKYLQDEEGYFVYCGRNDDMLKVSGLYVSPFEVEGALQSHADVLECAVVAWLDGDGLIKPKAFVVLKEQGKACDALARVLQDHVKAMLAPFKYPRWIEFRADLPKTATGKIQRFRLRAEGPGG
ncbi:MAG: benzoate-CoA ligase family protein [Pseudorhodoplanes sp.]|uniref:benzoate-CoA ligase family protein n=1 Tax=Pseudorhodoplanes sp. TaxID=1934341 RepID=UPI003D0F03B3